MSGPLATTLPGVLEEIAEAGPTRPALFYNGTQLSYAELPYDARRAARGLAGLGIQLGERVGVLLGNQPEWLSSSFAAAYAGATVVPVNAWYKRDEIAWTLRHAGVRVLDAAPTFLKHDYWGVLPEIATELPSLEAMVFTGPPGSGGYA